MLLRLLEDPELRRRGADEQSFRITWACELARRGSSLSRLGRRHRGRKLVERGLVGLVGELLGVPSSPELTKDLAAELNGHLDFWRDVRHRLASASTRRDASSVHWISGGGRYRTAWLNAAPLQTADILRERLFSAPEAMHSCLGHALDRRLVRVRQAAARPGRCAGSAQLNSPFDYHARRCCTCPTNPGPTQAGYQPLLERTILDVVSQIGGAAGAVYQSRPAARHVLRAQRAAASTAITLLAQGIDESSRTRLLESFRRGTRRCCSGPAFWEGIDVPAMCLAA